MIHPRKMPSLVIADDQGNITDFPELHMAGMAAGLYIRPELTDLIPLPEGSELFQLPMRLPVGFDPTTGEPLLLEEHPYEPSRKVTAVAAFMAPAHTTILNSGYQSLDDCPTLPLFAYTAVGWLDDQFWVAAFRSDLDKRQDCDQYHQQEVEHQTRKKLKKYKNNRLVQHLGKCCLTYGCPAARNYFLSRWEAPLPTSPHCNARCVGCISLQESGCCPATQDRISFVPSPNEIREMASEHLANSPRPIVSFGQGCEGEPLLQASTIHEAIKLIREDTTRGTINLNSNASLPDEVAKLAAAGLDSIRVSLNSAQKQKYQLYYRPKGYEFEAVLQSIKVMKEHGRFVSLNYFILPGFTDSVEEYEALCGLITNCSPDFIQLRNLNMDPEWYLSTIEHNPTQPMGIVQWHEKLAQEFPKLQFGYYNPSLDPNLK